MVSFAITLPTINYEIESWFSSYTCNYGLRNFVISSTVITTQKVWFGLFGYLFLLFFLHQKEKPSDVKNQSYREEVEQVHQRVCQKSQVLKSGDSNSPVSAHEVTHILLFKDAFVRVIEFLFPHGLQLKFCYKRRGIKIKTIVYSSALWLWSFWNLSKVLATSYFSVDLFKQAILVFRAIIISLYFMILEFLFKLLVNATYFHVIIVSCDSLPS